jgi:two-component system response regulator HydG
VSTFRFINEKNDEVAKMAKKILVVDDEESIRYTFDVFLTEAGYEVTTAESYDKALEAMARIDFDLIFADIFMEGKTGLDLLETVQQKKPNIPVIMITGVPSIETATESLRQGAFDYIMKPLRQDALLRSVSVALKHKDLAEEKEKCRLNFEGIFRSVKDGIVTVDSDMNVIEINNAACEICRVNREDIINNPIQDMAFHCQGKCFASLQDILRQHKSFEKSFVECGLVEEKQQVVSITTTPLLGHDDEFNGAVMLIRDETQLVELKRSLKKKIDQHSFIGNNPAIHKIRALIKDLADIQTTVLITGESGTGKELIVEALHYNSTRRNSPLVKVNCGALSENLLESELFGHVKGAFTGAFKDKVGRFQCAEGGTLFIDEISDISPRIQLRLLRALESKEFERVGDSNTIRVDVRIVAATNQELKKKVASGEFRQDLYYRLKVVEILLPPLRERMDDIPLLANHFLAQFNKKFNKNIKGLSSDAWAALFRYSWPGNIRELENTLEHAFIRCHQDVITLHDLPQELLLADKVSDGQNPLTAEQEAQALRMALEKARWNKSRAAEILGISRRTIYRKMDKLNISIEES